MVVLSAVQLALTPSQTPSTLVFQSVFLLIFCSFFSCFKIFNSEKKKARRFLSFGAWNAKKRRRLIFKPNSKPSVSIGPPIIQAYITSHHKDKSLSGLKRKGPRGWFSVHIHFPGNLYQNFPRKPISIIERGQWQWLHQGQFRNPRKNGALFSPLNSLGFYARRGQSNSYSFFFPSLKRFFYNQICYDLFSYVSYDLWPFMGFSSFWLFWLVWLLTVLTEILWTFY